ncbi:hypothetical protein [Agromyces ramosus]|uniref:Ribbon-helix-helix CopG family protein n=1 Tax=Agromyces ramosus TaxID=33879 RepID=A0ABU0R8P8_9MICO|nr:hypothetical protein [Agromyces ramosus]MDQ0894448.1 hypothetical protein [Agromyces ramosus]
MNVTVTLPDRVWARLASIADEKGVKVADLIADGVHRIVEPPKTPRRFVSPIPDPKLRTMIRDLRVLHRSVADISNTLQLDAHRVAATVRDLGFETKRGRPRTNGRKAS